MISCSDVSPNLNTYTQKCFIRRHHLFQTGGKKTSTFLSLLSQRLLLIDAHVEVDWLDSEQHPALDFSRQNIKHGCWQWDPNVDAISIPCDDRQHVEGRPSSCLSYLDITESSH